MRTAVLAIAAAAGLAACGNEASALDLPVPGMTLDTEVKAWHEVDAETNHLTINPEVNWTPNAGALTLTAGTVITAYETRTAGDNFILFDALDEGSRPNIDLGAEYDLGNGGELFATTSWDVDAEDRTELKVGVSFNF